MPCINSLKRFVPIFLITLLVLSAASPALAVPATKVKPDAAPADGQSPPAIKHADNKTSPLTAPDNDTLNTTPPGRGKIGNLKLPPAISGNPTQKIKEHVNDARLNAEKKVATAKIDITIRQMQLYQKMVVRSGLDEEQKADIESIVDTNIAWFRQLEGEIQNAEDLESIQALADQASQQADTIKVSIKKEAGIMACDRLDSRISTALNASAGVAEKIATLNARGIDTAKAEQKLASYDAHVDAAASYSLDARTAFEGITDADNVDNGFDEGYRQIRLANQEMINSYVDLKNVYLWYLQASQQNH